MSSFLMEEYIGNGVLKGIIPKLTDGGWDDVPTIKIMNLEDMDFMKLTQHEKDALEIRSYLHDRSLMAYADALEASGKSLPELLMLKTSTLSLQYNMKANHITRFIDRGIGCGKSYNNNMSSRTIRHARSSLRSSSRYEVSVADIDDFKVDENHVYKGIVSSRPDKPRLCCYIKAGDPVIDCVAPYSSIENISVVKLTNEHKAGMNRLMMETASMKASNLWSERPVILLCLRRPGCIMCRAEAHQLYAKKPIFDSFGVELIAVLHEDFQNEVKELWPRYWGGAVVLDRNREFFKALGGGKLLKDTFLSGFLLNPRSIANYKRAKASGLESNSRGEGSIKGGLFIIGSGKSGVAYQFIERNFGDWAPIKEVVEICKRMRNYSGIKEGPP